jgi:antitoxin PrlF
VIITMTSKGQVTLPVQARRRLGLEAGTKLAVSITDDRLELAPVKEPLESLRGMLKAKRHLSLDEIQSAIARGATE